MLDFLRRPMAVVIVSLSVTPGLAAQVDYRNLDFERPFKVSDAYPVERFAFEFSYRSSYSRFDGTDAWVMAPHLDHGLGRNLMVGAGFVFGVAGSQPTPEALSLEALWSPRRETPGLPGLGLHAELHTGRGVGTALEITGLATRSFGRSRVHLNLAATPFRADDDDERWWAGLAWDRSLLRTSTLVALEINATQRDGSLGWSVGGGLRRQVAPTMVLYLGASQAINGASVTELNAGFSRAFGIRGLMRRAAR